MERVILRRRRGCRAGRIEECALPPVMELTIGRDPASGIRFDCENDDLVGRRHARITRIARHAADPSRCPPST